MFELTAARTNLLTVAAHIRECDFAKPTPCPDWPVAAVLDHILGLSDAFTRAAQKEPASEPPSAAPRLPRDWYDQLEERTARLVSAWSHPAAWEGVAAAGGVEMPAEVMGVVVLDELTLHAWDLAVATGQGLDVPDADTAVLLEFTGEMAAPEAEAMRKGLFGPVVTIEQVEGFDLVLANAGRNPSWKASA